MLSDNLVKDLVIVFCSNRYKGTRDWLGQQPSNFNPIPKELSITPNEAHWRVFVIQLEILRRSWGEEILAWIMMP